MKSLNVLNKRSWNVGDTREATKEQLDKLVVAGLYNSYDKVYIIDNLKWKIIHWVANEDGSSVYTLSAVEEAGSEEW